jgi:catalase
LETQNTVASSSIAPDCWEETMAEHLKKARLADAEIARGIGGETHQTAGHGQPALTTQQGTPVSDDQNSLRAGDRGPGLMEDFHLREKLFHFDHERIPERVVHARGFGAHGFFENYESLADITAADLFQRAGEKTPAFVRFSTVAGNKGSADLARDVRGFAVKLYTKQGNWDIVGNNIPVFFIQDAMKFPDLVHAVKEEPDRGFPQAATAHDNFWDFVSLMPEATHMLMWAMSDRAIPRSFRFMEGFGVGKHKDFWGLMPPRLELALPHCRWRDRDTIPRREIGVCHQARGFGFAAAGARRASSTASAGVWRSAC